MFISKVLGTAIVAFGVASGASALAAGPHAHGDPHAHAHEAAAARLHLDHGKKWQTDDVLPRHGRDPGRDGGVAAVDP